MTSPTTGITPSIDKSRGRALITGASKGIGAAIAKQLARDGFSVILNYRSDHQGAQSVASEITEAGGEVELACFDVRDREKTLDSLAKILESGDDISCLVNNAGVSQDAPFPSMEPDAWDNVTRTTLDGFYNVTRPLVMPMVRKKWGRIVNISSVSGVIGNRGQTNYSAAKAGLIGATRSLSLELAKRNVTVNAIAPGLIETEMIKNSPVDEIKKHIPMRRIGQAAEVADLVSFICSDKAAYITGQVIGINGGLA